ncbi:MAG TPA: tRNA (adenosine(37)-N6)-threonylcarbamoyltransferase complex dimerization subunit type 1 TsaB [Candidatus Sulfotelmatobacter sp.]|nr:tRNA (adenosine(37)-N6)-threonylcarbamoyltransferase complex dimerization subunit type 1 TsaB [Candidatus Sulfotelmatobacter sp.]HWI59781.1 tRNA (adenosine(37)-N6)-threonylcarbamoyltransferase complex dimerization subunit type 1 TsaB [Bacillota bacterium]
MKILALEFSSAQRSVAVLETTATASLLGEVIETGERATHALGLIEAALREAELEREQMECLAVGLGPGSYTGIRAAIAVAQGWQLVGRVKLLGISTAEGLAAQAHEEGIRGPVTVVIDAQRNEFYLAGYALNETGWREVQPLRLASLAEAQARAQAGDILAGPEVNRWFPEGRLVFPRAATLGRLAASRQDFIAGEKMEPIYLRETTFVKAPPPRVVPE